MEMEADGNQGLASLLVPAHKPQLPLLHFVLEGLWPSENSSDEEGLSPRQKAGREEVSCPWGELMKKGG